MLAKLPKRLLLLTTAVILLNILITSPIFGNVRGIDPYVPKGKATATVSAFVGEFYLSISGFVSPYASVVLTSDGLFIASTVADSHGNFYFSQILIKRGFSHFCLDAVDFKRIGESYTCISFPPAQASIKKEKIFLPPTIGLSKSVIAQGEKTYAFGYTMPGALVTLHLSNGRVATVLADSSGYYMFTIDNLPAGTYSLFATANYQNQESLSPTKKIELRSLSAWDKFIAFLRDLWNRLIGLLTSIALGPLWLGIPIIILIIILIVKLWPEKFTFIYENKLFGFLHRKAKQHLHHYWEFNE